jgi:hypothetical protein
MTCNHKHVLEGAHGRYCKACGALVDTEVGRGDQYFAALADSRTLGWHEAGKSKPPTGEAFYAHMPSVASPDGSMVIRFPAGAPLPPHATHWHSDSLGLPAAAPVARPGA